ncbi:MAG: SDR family oxidoreductase [Flammeovirgaceae bacterium]
MNLDLTNKHAIVCGSSQGIGKAIAIELAQLGAHITLLARNRERLAQVKEELAQQGNQIHHVLIADFSNPDSVKAAITQHVATNPAHILINNTGGPPAGPAAEATAEEFLAAYSAHLLCNHHLMQAVVPAMKETGFGRIINIISTSVKAPIPNLGVSNTTRGAVANWAKTLANELGPFGITVNNVLPGLTHTGRLSSLIDSLARKNNRSTEEQQRIMEQTVPARRVAQPEEVAAAAAFLASPAAAYINGINLPVDGGRTPAL